MFVFLIFVGREAFAISNACLARGILFSAMAEARRLLLVEPGWMWSTRTLETIVEASQFDTIGVNLSSFDFGTRQAMEEELLGSLIAQGSPVVTLEHRSDPYDTLPRFLTELDARFPPSERRKPLSPEVSAISIFATEMARIREIVQSFGLTESRPLYIVIRGMIPFSERHDRLSSFVKELHDTRFKGAFGDEWARAVRVIVSSATSMQRWARQNVGMTGGEEFVIRPPRS